MALIGLITDFGLQDEYVGLMKAVILGIDPAAVSGFFYGQRRDRRSRLQDLGTKGSGTTP